MSSGDRLVDGVRDKSAPSNHDETDCNSSNTSICDLSDGDIIRWQGWVHDHICRVCGNGEGARVVGPTVQDRPRVLAGNVLEALPHDEIIGSDQLGHIHLRDGDSVEVVDPETHERVAPPQNLEGFGIELWLIHVKDEAGWDTVHGRYRAILEADK